MGMTIDDIKHCLKVMVGCEVCEECNLYGMTGTDHCEHDCVYRALDICVYGALDIIDKYQKIKQIVNDWENSGEEDDPINIIDNIEEVLEDENVD